MPEAARVYAERPLRGRQGQRQARLAAVAAGPVRRRGRPQPRAAGVPVQPLPLLRRQARGAGAGDLRRRAGADQLPRAAGREAPDAGDLPHPPRVRRALEEGEPPPRRHRRQRRRARRGRRRARSAKRSNARPASRSSCRAGSTTTSSAASSCRSATWSWTRASAVAWRNFERPSRPRRKEEQSTRWRSSRTRSQAFCESESRGWRPTPPTSPRSAPSSPWRTASPASTASTTAWRWRCSTCRTGSPGWP